MGSPRGDDLESLRRYLEDTALAPPGGLAERIYHRISLESPSTAPRRFRAAIRFGDVRAIWRGFWQNVTTAASPRARVMLRLQAMTTVGIAVLIVSVGSAGVLAAAGVVVTEIVEPMTRKTNPATQPAPVTLPTPATRGSVVLPAGGSGGVSVSGGGLSRLRATEPGLELALPLPLAPHAAPGVSSAGTSKSQAAAKGKSQAAAKGKSQAPGQTTPKGKSQAAAKGKSQAPGQAVPQAPGQAVPQAPGQAVPQAPGQAVPKAKGPADPKGPEDPKGPADS